MTLKILILRNRNSVRNTSKKDTNEAGTNNDTTKCSKRTRPENVDSNEHQLPDNPLYHSYQVNDASGNENQISTEQLPDNPLYHSYLENDDKGNSKIEKDDAGASTSPENNAVYTIPIELAKASTANQDDSNESENVYAQVNKTKKISP